MRVQQSSRSFALCVEVGWKIWKPESSIRSSLIVKLRVRGYIRVVDESGEDYIYLSETNRDACRSRVTPDGQPFERAYALFTRHVNQDDVGVLPRPIEHDRFPVR